MQGIYLYALIVVVPSVILGLTLVAIRWAAKGDARAIIPVGMLAALAMVFVLLR